MMRWTSDAPAISRERFASCADLARARLLDTALYTRVVRGGESITVALGLGWVGGLDLPCEAVSGFWIRPSRVGSDACGDEAVWICGFASLFYNE